MSASLLNQRGFNLQNLGGARISGHRAKPARNLFRDTAFLNTRLSEAVAATRMTSRDGFNAARAAGVSLIVQTNVARPGISPDLFNHFLLDRGVFMSLDELGPALPSLERVLIPCPMSGELKDAYKKLDDELKNAVKKRVNGKGPPGLAATRVQALDAFLDTPSGWSPIIAPTYSESGQRYGTETVAWPADLGGDHVDSKDTKLVEIVRAELRSDRRCAIYPQFTGVHDVRPKLLKILTDAGIRALVMPDTVKPEAREDWIQKHLAEMDVLICHPKRVMTGLDLIEFPSLIWYQTGYSTHVLRQASARARRADSDESRAKCFSCITAARSRSLRCRSWAKKNPQARRWEGVFDTNALRAMMNGGEDSDILSALANTLDAGKKFDARRRVEVCRTQAHRSPDCLRKTKRRAEGSCASALGRWLLV